MNDQTDPSCAELVMPGAEPIPLGAGRPVGAPQDDRFEHVNVTVGQVRTALAVMGRTSPDHARLAEIADALLVRLDTIRDECKFMTAFFTMPRLEKAGDPEGAQLASERARRLCGDWGQSYSLSLPRRGPPPR